MKPTGANWSTYARGCRTVSDNVQVALITALGGAYAVTMTILVPLLFSMRKHARNAARDSSASRQQVQNDHPTNLRDDIDKVLRAQSRQGRAINGIRGEMRHTRQRVSAIEDRMNRTTNH